MSALSDLFQPPDYTGQYNTPLTPVGQALYQQQMGARAADMRDYDLQGAWAAGGGGPPGAGHMPDTFKKPNHPTFSTGSMYAGPGTDPGVWSQLPGGPTAPWSFVPGATNQANFGMANLQQYFDRREPGNFLVPPQ